MLRHLISAEGLSPFLFTAKQPSSLSANPGEALQGQMRALVRFGCEALYGRLRRRRSPVVMLGGVSPGLCLLKESSGLPTTLSYAHSSHLCSSTQVLTQYQATRHHHNVRTLRYLRPIQPAPGRLQPVSPAGLRPAATAPTASLSSTTILSIARRRVPRSRICPASQVEQLRPSPARRIPDGHSRSPVWQLRREQPTGKPRILVSMTNLSFWLQGY